MAPEITPDDDTLIPLGPLTREYPVTGLSLNVDAMTWMGAIALFWMKVRLDAGTLDHVNTSFRVSYLIVVVLLDGVATEFAVTVSVFRGWTISGNPTS